MSQTVKASDDKSIKIHKKQLFMDSAEVAWKVVKKLFDTGG